MKEKDSKFADMKQNYEKTQQVLAVATRLLHREEDKLRSGQDQLERLRADVGRLFPRFERYVHDTELQKQIASASANALGGQQIDHQLYVEFNE